MRSDFFSNGFFCTLKGNKQTSELQMGIINSDRNTSQECNVPFIEPDEEKFSLPTQKKDYYFTCRHSFTKIRKIATIETDERISFFSITIFMYRLSLYVYSKGMEFPHGLFSLLFLPVSESWATDPVWPINRTIHNGTALDHNESVGLLTGPVAQRPSENKRVNGDGFVTNTESIPQ